MRKLSYSNSSTCVWGSCFSTVRSAKENKLFQYSIIYGLELLGALLLSIDQWCIQAELENGVRTLSLLHKLTNLALNFRETRERKPFVKEAHTNQWKNLFGKGYLAGIHTRGTGIDLIDLLTWFIDRIDSLGKEKLRSLKWMHAHVNANIMQIIHL